MAQRPRQHQLETESRNALRTAIPSAWVFRDTDQDYGIDAEVEIFDESNTSTGAKFSIQLKATDEVSLRKALRIRLPWSKVKYYSSMDLPVLIVRYHSSSNSLYYIWFHSLDPYYVSKTNTGISFIIPEVNIWNGSTPKKLSDEVTAYREINSPILRRPVRMSLSIEGEEVNGVEFYRIETMLRQCFREVSHILEIVKADDEKYGYANIINLTSEKCEIKLGGAHGCTFHTQKLDGISLEALSLAKDVMLAVGLALDHKGHPTEGAEIIARFWRGSYAIKDYKIVLGLAKCLARANQIHQALIISEELFKEESTFEVAQYLLLQFLGRISSRTGPEVELGVQILRRIIKIIEKKGGLETTAASLHYNCANLLRGMDRYKEALGHYRQAGRLDNSYLGRPYYWQELASVLFLSNRYAIASRMYSCSLDIKDDKHIKALYADSLLFAGEYKQAEEVFDGILTEPIDIADCEWALKSHAIDWIRKYIGVDKQKRITPIFTEDFNPALSQSTIGQTESACINALKSDALSAIAWFNIGAVKLREQDYTGALNCYLVAALVVPCDVESWINVISLAKKTENILLFSAALVTAYEKNGYDFLNKLSDGMSGNRGEFVKILTEGFDQLPKRKKEVLLRMHRQNGDWDELTYNPHELRERNE